MYVCMYVCMHACRLPFCRRSLGGSAARHLARGGWRDGGGYVPVAAWVGVELALHALLCTPLLMVLFGAHSPLYYQSGKLGVVLHRQL